MIFLKDRLNDRETLRMLLMAGMVRKNKDMLESKGEMGYDEERQLYHFTRHNKVNRGDFIRSALSSRWGSIISELKNRRLIAT